ncbi:MAG: insulinase family protein [Prolixibacteraceae bacterium]|jgi:zinc protease|nr:insulinase family protein [Prolixibacteraceae bacterium]MBT6763233.1 insulinase family protein [Prolixibacteraceae bacterium]MBT7000854.1 insulinase family protein [Prolixibacteraceae bacterium]MBT7395346.1 insulinase family protein [Prolixibacteraceae bacterium]
MKKIAVLLFTILIIVSGFISRAAEIEFKEFDLPNGLHVIVHEDNSVPIVAVSVMYHVGSKNEMPDRTGFAHFFEHLMFEGTKNIERFQYDKIVEQAGGTLNANTSNDRTYYYEILPSNQLELGLWLESERMLHARVDSIGIATQKGVVIEEKKQSYDNRPYGSFLPEILKRSFTKHPYNWATIGDPEHIRAAKDEEFKSFYDSFYVPNNAVLVLAGDIKFKDAKKLVKKYFSDIPAKEGEIYRPTAVEERKQEEVRDTVYDNIQLPAVFQAYHIPAMGSTDYYAVEMLSQLLATGQSSRLYKSLVDEQQLAIQVAAIPLPFEDPGLAITLALPNMGLDCATLEEAMDKEVEKVQNELIPDKEFQKLKNQVENNIVTQNSTIATRANTLARNYTYFNDAGRINTDLDKYLAVTKEDLKRVANEYFRKDNRVVLHYLPKSEEK